MPAMKLAKKSLLRPLGSHNRDPRLASLEAELTEALNATGIGPMGLGGDTTVLGVHIKMAACHTASHPVAVNLQCWAARQATLRIHAGPPGRQHFAYMTTGGWNTYEAFYIAII